MYQKFESFVMNLFRKIPNGFRVYALSALAFSSFLAFANRRSYWADTHHANGGLLTYGIVSAVLVVVIVKAALGEQRKPQ